MDNYKFTGILYCFFGALLFSTKAIFVKLCYEYDTDPVKILLLRMLVAVPVYVLIICLTKRKLDESKVVSKEGVWLILFGFIGYYLASFFDFKGLTFISAGLERVILYLYPTLVLLINALVFRESIKQKHVIAILLSYIGVSIAYAFDANALNHVDLFRGSVLIFLSALAYASYLVGSQWLIPKFGTVRFTAIAMIVSCICVIGHYLMEQGLIIPDYTREVLYYGILMGIFSTVIPSFMISEGIKRLGATEASIIASIGPISTIILSVVILGEVFNLYQGAGTLLVLCSVIYITITKRK